MNYDEQAQVASITGHIVLTDGSRSEFVIGTVSGEPYWSQWGGVSRERLSCTVDVLDSMQEAVTGYLVDADLDDDDTCSECGASLDDGQGYDGKCGNCADRSDVAECEHPNCGEWCDHPDKGHYLDDGINTWVPNEEEK